MKEKINHLIACFKLAFHLIESTLDENNYAEF